MTGPLPAVTRQTLGDVLELLARVRPAPPGGPRRRPRRAGVVGDPGGRPGPRPARRRALRRARRLARGDRRGLGAPPARLRGPAQALLPRRSSGRGDPRARGAPPRHVLPARVDRARVRDRSARPRRHPRRGDLGDARPRAPPLPPLPPLGEDGGGSAPRPPPDGAQRPRLGGGPLDDPPDDRARRPPLGPARRAARRLLAARPRRPLARVGRRADAGRAAPRRRRPRPRPARRGALGQEPRRPRPRRLLHRVGEERPRSSSPAPSRRRTSRSRPRTTARGRASSRSPARGRTRGRSISSSRCSGTSSARRPPSRRASPRSSTPPGSSTPPSRRSARRGPAPSSASCGRRPASRPRGALGALLAAVDAALATPPGERVPLALETAIARFEAWEGERPDAPLPEREKTAEALLRIYRVDTLGEEARYRLFRRTVFSRSAPEVLQAFDDLLAALRARSGARPSHLVELEGLHSALKSDEERHAFARLVFPAARTSRPVEVTVVGDAVKHVVLATELVDRMDAAWTVRDPVDAAEVGRLYRLFVRAGLPRAFSADRRYLVILDSGERIAGGVSYSLLGGETAQLDGLVVAPSLRGRGLSDRPPGRPLHAPRRARREGRCSPTSPSATSRSPASASTGASAASSGT